MGSPFLGVYTLSWTTDPRLGEAFTCLEKGTQRTLSASLFYKENPKKLAPTELLT